MLEPIPFAGYIDIEEMNNEPVAWMELYYGEPNNFAWTNAELRDSGDVYKTIPLYTHPAKTLTDEEIDDIGREHLTDGDGAIEFARAILRKASE
jgi:hypothetical protein